MWDPATAGLSGAERSRIASRRATATTCRAVRTASGPSRTLYVIIQNPHESLEDRSSGSASCWKADRRSRGPHRKGGASEGQGEAAASPNGWRSHDDARRRGRAPRLAGPAHRRDRRERHDGQGAARRARGSPIAWRSCCARRRRRWRRSRARHGQTSRLEAISARQVTELENDVLLLDDLIGRQRLEDLGQPGQGADRLRTSG